MPPPPPLPPPEPLVAMAGLRPVRSLMTVSPPGPVPTPDPGHAPMEPPGDSTDCKLRSDTSSMTVPLMPPSAREGDAAVLGRLEGTSPSSSCPAPGAPLVRADMMRLLRAAAATEAAVPGREREGLRAVPVLEAYGDRADSTREVRGRLLKPLPADTLNDWAVLGRDGELLLIRQPPLPAQTWQWGGSGVTQQVATNVGRGGLSSAFIWAPVGGKGHPCKAVSSRDSR